MIKELELDLFLNKKEFFLFLFIIVCILFVNIFFKYKTFELLKSINTPTVKAKVLNQYIKTKKSKTYTVLKLQAEDGYLFYTTTSKDQKDILHHDIAIKINTKKLEFLDMFRGFYAYSYRIKSLKENRIFLDFKKFIQNQHDKSWSRELFSALFLATPISKELRQKVSNLGISHLVAISGFHLGVLFYILYSVLTPLYRFFQNRYFPYRNSKFDLSVFIMMILAIYVSFLGFVPSLIRAFIMMVFLFVFYHRFIKILSFEVLFVAIISILAFVPSFFFSIGFWFSVSGVFFIYLYLHIFQNISNIKTIIFLNIWVYLAMLPIVHSVFDKFTVLQLFSPLLSILFTFFYPLELFLHTINQGGLLDSAIEYLLQQSTTIYHVNTPLWFLVLYVGLHLLLARINLLKSKIISYLS